MSGRNGHNQVRGKRDGGSLTKGVYLGSGATRTAYTCRVQSGCVAGYTQGSYLVYKNFRPELAARGYKVGPADAAMQQYCQRLAKIFNEEVEVSKEGYLCPVVIRDAAYKVVPNVGPVLLERKVEGRWTRFTSNSGWTGNNDPIIDFFSHWTYKFTMRELVVTDLQGHRGVPDRPPYLNYEYYYMLTDPCINSVNQEYGINDLGPAGIDAFFQNHICNHLCRRHGLHDCRPQLRPAQNALPLKRSTTASTAFITLVVSSLLILNLALAGIWFYVPYGPYIVLAHLIWGLFIDKAPVNGEGRIFNFLRHNWLWHFAQAYFSHKLRQEAPLNPEEKHLFVAHPHGIIALSSWLVFGGDSIHFLRNNRKLQVSIVTVGLNFVFPLWRDLLLSLGFLDASYASLRAVFKRGRSAVLMVGGSQEALESHPNTNRIVLDKRKGFIKLALVSGVKVVPVYTFGETNMFTQVANPRGSWLRSFQEALVGYLTISTPLLTSGPLPKSTPLLTVIGEAIDFPHLENPSSEDIEKYHGIYKTALQKLFDKHKRDFYSDLELQTADLQIVA